MCCPDEPGGCRELHLESQLLRRQPNPALFPRGPVVALPRFIPSVYESPDAQHRLRGRTQTSQLLSPLQTARLRCIMGSLYSQAQTMGNLFSRFLTTNRKRSYITSFVLCPLINLKSGSMIPLLRPWTLQNGIC